MSSGIGYRWGREETKRKPKSTDRKSVNLQTDQTQKSFLFYLNAGKCNVDFESSNYFQGCGVTGTFIFCWWECKFSLMRVLAVYIKVRITCPCDSEIPLLDSDPEKLSHM